MTQFWLIAAGMILLALGFVLLPLLRQRKTVHIDRNAINISVVKQQLNELESDLKSGKLEQSVYEAAKADLEKALLNDLDTADTASPDTTKNLAPTGRWLAAFVVVAIPLLSVTLYQKLGAPTAINPGTLSTAQTSNNQASMPQMTMEEAISRLAEKLEQEPDNAEGWSMLARSYLSVRQYDKAVGAFEKLYALTGDQPEVLVRYADALAMTQGGKITGKPYELLKLALKQDPQNAQANWMAGLAEEEAGNYTAALKHWEMVRPLLAGQPELMQTLDTLIARARAQTGEVVAESPQTTNNPTPLTTTQTAQKSITVMVELAPELAKLAQPQDSVFIFAQAMQGPPMPLAVSRQQAKDLPITVTLDDSMAMMPQMKLSSFDQVKVGARISKSGQAMPTSGDLAGSIEGIAPGQENVVRITIDQKIP